MSATLLVKSDGLAHADHAALVSDAAILVGALDSSSVQLNLRSLRASAADDLRLPRSVSMDRAPHNEQILNSLQKYSVFHVHLINACV